MATSVKVSMKTKRKIEKLQELLTLVLGRKITYQEVLNITIDEALQDFDSIVKRLSKKKKLTDKEIEKILSEIPMDLGVKTSKDDIDKTVYGEE